VGYDNEIKRTELEIEHVVRAGKSRKRRLSGEWRELFEFLPHYHQPCDLGQATEPCQVSFSLSIKWGYNIVEIK
jgi:hypothetical protein